MPYLDVKEVGCWPFRRISKTKLTKVNTMGQLDRIIKPLKI